MRSMRVKFIHSVQSITHLLLVHVLARKQLSTNSCILIEQEEAAERVFDVLLRRFTTISTFHFVTLESIFRISATK